MFLPETTPTQAGVVTPGTQPVTDSDYALADKVVRALLAKPAGKTIDQLSSYILDYIQVNNLLLPISQIVGFSQFTAQIATPITTNETTGSTSYVDLTTTGPTLSGLSDGAYVFLFGAEAKNSTGGDGAVMSLSYNGSGALDSDSALVTDTNFATIVGFATATLTSGANTVTAKYRADVGGTANFQRRKLLALRYANI